MRTMYVKHDFNVAVAAGQRWTSRVLTPASEQTSKAGLHSLAKMLANDFKHPSIAVSVVQPPT